MRTLGLLGGLTWQSTALYYRLLNEAVRQDRGGSSSAPLILHSVDFAPIEQMQRDGRWDDAAEVLASAALGLEAGGAQALLICANTMHKVAPQVEAAVGIPLIHLADVTADAVLEAGLDRVLLVGTRYTMEQPFLRDRLSARGLDVAIPEAGDRDVIHSIIYDELVIGRFESSSRDRLVGIVDVAVDGDRTGVVLACTELELLIGPDDLRAPSFPTTDLHAAAGAAFILGK